MSAWRQQSWAGRRGLLACLLWPASIFIHSLVLTRHALYRAGIFKSVRIGLPGKPLIVVVGNVIAGGAGKTPVTIALLAHLQTRGLRVGVASRGYGRTSRACLEVQTSSPVSEVGDEPLLIKQTSNAPVFVAPKRANAVRALLNAYPKTQVVVCDDGLQHYALQRDIEIALFDERGVGNGWLLPAGLLREPWPKRLGWGIDLVLSSGSIPPLALGEKIKHFTSQRRLASFAKRADGSTVPLASLKNYPLHALAGIAKPQAFFDMLRAQGLTLSSTEALPDHYDFDSYEAPSNIDSIIVCTEKDAVKLFASLDSTVRTRVLSVPLVVEPEAAFLAAFDALVSKHLA